jgi:hypothetical protein
MMSRRHFDSTENAELRAKIDDAKQQLPLPRLMRELNYEEKHIRKSAVCPFHKDEHPSFSVFQSNNGKGWQWKCHVGCGYGDEIAFLVKHFDTPRREAIRCYLDMAGFPSRAPGKSRECPAFRASRASPAYPVSEGQGLNGRLEQVLKALAARNACAKANTARSRRWQLARDVTAIERGIARELNIDELIPVFDEWYRLSEPFLDPAKTRDAYLAAFLKELRKVRVPTGEGDTLNKAVEAVSKLADSELPIIPGLLAAPESWRRLLALHRELFSRSKRKNKTYFLSYRDAAKAHNSLSHQGAYDITLAFERLGFIKIVDKGKPGSNGGKAAEFRYLLPETESAEDDDEIPV